MGTIANLAIKITANAAELKAALSDAASAVSATGSKIQGVGAKMTAGVTLPLVGMGAAALKAATDFNAGMANVASLGVPIERVNDLKDAVQDMSVELGKSTGDLSDGLYQVVSAFGDSADTVELLRINAQAAAAGLATTTDAINLTSSVTKAYGDTSSSAVQQVSDLAFQAVKLGQTTFPELASSMGRVAPLAASLGVGVEELFGTMATFTGVTGTASEVSTQLRGVLQSMMAPTESMNNLIASLGFASGGAMMQQLGLQGSIEAIVQAANATGTPLQNYIGSIEGQTLALAATGGQADVFSEKLAAMGNVMGASDAAFAAQTQGVNALGFQWSQLMMRLSVFAQRIGDALVPAALALLAALEPLISQAESLLGVFESLDPTTQAIGIGIAAMAALAGPALLALGTAMTMIAPAISAVGAALGLLISPVGLVIAAVVALGAAWTMNLGGIQEITASAWASLQPTLQAIGDAISNVVNYLVATVETGDDRSAFGYIRKLPEMLQAPTLAMGEFVVQAQTAWSEFVASGASVVDWLQSLLPTAISAATTAWEQLPGAITAIQGGFDWLLEQGAVVADWLQSLLPTAISAATTAWEQLPGVLSTVQSGFTWLVTQGAIVVAWLQTAIPAAISTAITAWEQLPSALTQVQTTLTTTGNQFTTLQTTVTTAFNDLIAQIQPILAQVGEILAPALERVKEAFGGVGESVGSLAPHFEGLLAAVQGMGETILPIIQGLATALGVTLVVAASVGMNLVAAAIQNLASIVAPMIDQITATITLLSTTVSNVAKLVMAVATGDWAGAWTAMQNIVGGFKTYFESTLENVKSFGIAIFDTLKTTVLATLGDLDSSAKGQMDALKGWWDGVWSSLTRAFEPVKSGIETVKTAVDGLKKAIEDFSGWISSISIPNPFAGIQMPSLPSLPGFGGGEVGGEQLGTAYAHGGWSWVGENRRPELLYLPRGSQVVPWQQAKEMAGQGGGVNVTIQQANIRSEQDIWELAYRIREIGRREDW